MIFANRQCGWKRPAHTLCAVPRSLFLSFLLPLVLLSSVSRVAAHSAGPIATRAETLCVGKGEATTFSDLLCCFQKGMDPQHCLDDRIPSLMEGKTTKEAIDLLEAETKAVPELEQECHAVVHSIGRHAFLTAWNFGTAFHSCDHRCQAGCYHGVLERVFFSQEDLDRGINHLSFEDLEGKIPELCSRENFSDPSLGLLIQCAHGLGHAILYTLDYELDDALRGCDLLPSETMRASCLLGVFMENVVGDRELRDLKADEPLYPCTRVAEPYKRACYKQQTKVMLHMELSYAEIAAQCALTGEYRGVCFEGLGRDTSAGAREAEAEAVRAVARICEEHAGDFLVNCVGGAVRALDDFSWDGRYSLRYCAALSADDARDACYRIAREHLGTVYGMSDNAIDAQCDVYGGEGCRRAAVPFSFWAWLLSIFPREYARGKGPGVHL